MVKDAIDLDAVIEALSKVEDARAALDAALEELYEALGLPEEET
jgi:hypothetical protein